MIKSLAINTRFVSGGNGLVVPIEGAIDTCIFVTGHNTFKLQGSKDGGSTYADIAGSSTPGNGSTDKAISVFACQVFDHIKVVIDQGTCWAVRQWTRTTPVGPSLLATANQKNLIDPQLGTP